MSLLGIVLLVLVVLFLCGGGVGHYNGNLYMGNGGVSIGFVLLVILIIVVLRG